jgi:hypothetical protein
MTLMLLSHVSNAMAEDLTLSVKGVNPRFRSQAPVPIELTLNWNSSKLMEGKLRLEVVDSLTELLVYENPDIAMGFGDFVQRIVLPPLPSESGEVEIKATFASPTWGNYELGSFKLKVPAEWRRQMLIGLVTPAGDTAVKGVYEYLDGISLDQYRPARQSSNELVSASNEFDVINVRFGTRDLPTRAAPLCAYDMIVLSADTLQELKLAQRTALLAWVDAGGSLLVDASGLVTDSDCEFLNELSGRIRGENAFLPGGNDRVVGTQSIVYARRGFGRVVVATDGPANFSEAERFKATCWLWKVRSGTQNLIREKGKWKDLEVQKRAIPRDYESGFPGGEPNTEVVMLEAVVPPYAPKPLRSGLELPRSLLPDSVEVVPLPVVMLVLGLFLLVIAPGDWFLLGWLKKRMLTWLFFPAMCLLFTGIMVFLAYQYVGKEDYRTALRFVDWATADRVARITDVETLFTSTASPIEVELSNQLFSPVNTDGTVDWQASGSGYMNNTRLISEDSKKPPRPTITGRPTTLFTVELPVKKWTPTVSRYTSFALDTKDTPAVDWAGVGSAEVFSGPEALVDRLREANAGAGVIVLRGDRKTKPRVVDERTDDFMRVAIEASVRSAKAGLFSVVSALSPNGHESLEDVAVLDVTDSDEALVLVVFGAANDVIVHRRLFHREESTVGR